MGKEALNCLIKQSEESLAECREVNFYIEVRTFIKHNPLWLKNHLWEISRNGTKHSFYILTEDITNEKITESTLEITNHQLGLMMDNSEVGMCLMHLDVDFKHLFDAVRLRVLRVNQTFLDFSGFSRETVLNWTEKEAFAVIHPHDFPGFKMAMTKAFLNKFKKPFTYEYRALRSDGSYIKVRIIETGVQQPDKSFMLITNYVVLE